MVMYAGRKVEEAPVRDLFAIRAIPIPGPARLGAAAGRDARRRRAATACRDPGVVPSLREPIVGCAFAPRCAYATERCRAEAPPLEAKRPGHLAA